MQLLVSEKAEAIHLYPSEAPVLEVHRVLHRLEGPTLVPGEVDELFHAVAAKDDVSELASAGMVSFYFHFEDIAVFQVMAFREDGHIRLEIRRFR
jgi:Tfp pilus assembly pilus retraction ATPase PilT